MATFITSKLTGQTISIGVETTTGYWKYNHNSTDSSVFSNGPQIITVANANGEFTIISCLSDGTVSGNITGLGSKFNQLTSFDGTGLSSLTNLILEGNQLTSFDGTGLSDLTELNLQGNQLTSFDGTDLSGLSDLNLTDNQIISLDVTPMTSLSQLRINNNPITPQNWDSILSGLVSLGNEDGSLRVGTTQRTNASTADYDTLISRNWAIDGTFEIYTPPTFITSKLTGETINIYVETSTGYWKYNHNGTDSSVFSNGGQSAEIINANGEFTIISWDNDNEEVGGDVTSLHLNNNQLISFDGTGLSSLTDLNLYDNQLTSFDGTGLTSLTGLDLNNNQLTSFDGTGLSSLTDLNLEGNLLTSFIGTGLSGLTGLVLAGNLLTGLDISSLESLINLTMNGKAGDNPLSASANDSILDQLEANGLTDGSFITTGGRTSAGTGDYDTLISRGWTIEGADLVSVVRKLRVKGVGQLNP